MKIKKLLFGSAMVLLAMGAVACRKGCTDPEAFNYDPKAKRDDGSCLIEYPADTSLVYVTQDITINTTWTADKTYILTKRIAVTDGATLTIDPGTIIKGEAGTGVNATSLIITRGSKIMAQGTASQPIIFTSIVDEIQPGEIKSPNLPVDLDGLWGGLLILGNAQISADAPSAQIEGIPVSDPNGLYGGDNDEDNSGILEYVSIRHGGANIGATNEINGLTLGGVGSGTVINHIEIIANLDDGIEWFGGTVNVSDVVVWNAGDDAIDTDQSWGGTLDNFAVINPANSALELDGPEGPDGTVERKHIIQNGTVKAEDLIVSIVDNDPNSWVDLLNIYFFDLSSGQTFDEIPTEYTCLFENLQVTIPDDAVIEDFFLDGSAAFVTEVAEGANTVGFDNSEFVGWSWTYLEGALDF